MDIVTCPFCMGVNVSEVSYPLTLPYKGEYYDIIYHSYMCPACNKEFQNDEQLTRTLSQIPQYMIDTDKPLDI